ncbi:MAG: hypothetical protein GF381_03085, partial [Candidatus Pacebacteria bacterium]|nr:hypothetical protein [Candidatus Paceibacterota bacterium]
MSVFPAHFKLPLDTQQLKNHKNLWLISLFISLILSTVALAILLFFVYQNKFYQGIYLDDLHLGGETKATALAKLEKKSFTPPEGELIIWLEKTDTNEVHATHSTSLALNKVVVGRNYEQILDQAFLVGRQGGVWTKIKAIAGIY